MQIDQIMGPDITALSRIRQIGHLLKMLTLVRYQCSIDTQNALRRHLGSSKTRE